MKHIYVFLMTLFIGSFGFTQTTIFNEGGGGSEPTDWTFENNISSNPIDKGSYWLVDAGSTSDFITTATYDLSSYTDAEFTLDVASFNSGGYNRAKIEISFDGGSNYTQTETSTITTGSSYLYGGTFTLNSVSSQVVIRISNNGTSGRGVRLRNLELTASGVAVTCTTPTTQASLYNTTALGTTSATLNWTTGNGDEVLVLVKEGSAVDTDPESGTDYTGSTTFTSGDQIGTGNYVVQSGSATSSVSITGLSEATTYHVAVYEYNTIDTCYELTELTGNFTTECSTPSEVYTFTATAGIEEVDLTWSNGSCYDEVLIIAKETSAVTVTPTGDGSAYTANATFGSSADLGTSEYAVYKGIGTSVTVTGLTNGNTYHFSVFTRKATSWSAAVADDATLDCTAPAIQASAFTTLLPTATGVSIEFTRGDGDKVLVLMKEGSTVDEDPISGTSYTANSNFGDLSADELGTGNFAVYNGNEGSNPGIGGDPIDFNINGLSQGTTYHLAVYEYNDTNTCYNLTELTGSFTTLCAKITSFPFTEGFEGGALPSCWSQEYETGTVNWAYQDGNSNSSLDAHIGTKNAYFYDTNGDQTKLITPALDLTGVSSPTLSFWHAQVDWSGDQDELRVYYKTSAGGTWTLIPGQEFTSSIGSWTQESVLLPNPSSDYYIAFDATGNYGRGVVLDDIEINGDIPTTDTLVEFTASTATVIEDAGTYDLEFSITNEDAAATSFDVVLTSGDGDATDIDGYTTQTVTFPGGTSTNQTVTLTITDDTDLETDETLMFEIQNVSGGNNAVAGSNSTFTLTITNNDVTPPIALPYSEDFSDCGAAEWTPYDEAGSNSWLCGSGEYAMNGYGSTNVDWLISDFSIDFSAYSSVKIDITTQEQYGDNINTPGEFELLYSTDYSGGDPTIATWTALSFDPNNTEFGGGLSSPSVTSVDASGITGVAYIAFKYDMNFGNGAEDWRVQNIDIYEDIALDADTEATDPNTQIATTTIIAADATTSITSLDAFAFSIYDFGSTDGLPTNITMMRFVPGANNTADWSDHIQGITLVDENAATYTPTTTTINDTEIILEFSTPIVIADDSILEFTLGVYLNTTNIVDESIIQFQIDAASNGFAANTSGSGFADPFSGDVIGNDIIVDVYVTELVFSQQPSNTFVNTAMTPDVTVSAIDTNGNIDTSYNLDIEITSTGTLTGSPLVATPVNGVVTFAGLTHTALGTALVLTADDDLYPTVNSSAFDIEAIPVDPVIIAIQDFDDTTPEWTYTTSPSENNSSCVSSGDVWNVVSSLGNITVPNSTGNFFGGQDLEGSNGCGTSGIATIDFNTIDTSNYTSITVSFDYEVDGFNGASDELSYIITLDTISETEVFLCDGCDQQNNEGTISMNVPDGTNTISLQILAKFNGGSDYFGVDNFKIEGIVSPSPTTYTYNGTWSPSDPNGAATANDDIVITSGDATIDINTTANSVTVKAGAGLTVDTGVTLTTTNGLALESVSNSYSSLILNGTVAGAVSYQRHINNAAESGEGTGSNDLVSPPLTGQSFGAFRIANTNILSGEIDNISPGTIFYLFSPFNTALNEYTYYSESDDSETLDAGNGYRTGSTSLGNQDTYTFSGTVETATVTKSIVAPAASNWNLIGNPYPSYFKIEEFLLDNIAQFDFSSSGIYGYDGLASDGWDIWNLARAQDPTNAGAVIAPGQGFFVASIPVGGSVTFDPDHRVTGTSDDFISGRSTNSITNLELTLNNSSASFITDIYFTASATQSLDPGYDSSLFKSQINDFSLYSHLVMDNTNVPLAIQSLGETDYTDVTIPLGVHAFQGEQLTFSISASTLPNTVSVYLEDNVANTSTLLNTSDYVLTPSTGLSGIGRFYLRVSNSTLSTVDNTLDQLNIYTNKTDKTIIIAGQLLEPTTASVYDVQGRLVSTTQLQTTVRSQAIDVSNLSLGIYVVKLHNAAQNKTQKVIIR
ncbi:T9SS type A sorting domain-containing protein [Winogradskyella thalassocola]|uniref:Por secretion system C-terminal sorting domain-containing protein n=1 Tax=Winogradskyella thalassocola TaxID=262004 RepID=A0A1G7YZG6_9FLAO|nr:T9SS type A sorting domain-containing protein [Winogradskyella thalassocola]SDH01774.1 Por secretion system C-terminal sorting domain-containing protein [Winogradskyella thalassocola]